MKEYRIVYIKRCKCEATVHAKSKEDARHRFEKGEQEDEIEIDTLDIEVTRVDATE